MKRKDIYAAAQAGAIGKRAGKMTYEELMNVVEILKRGEIADAVMLAYNAGYYRGAVAATRGQYIPNQGNKKTTGGTSNV